MQPYVTNRENARSYSTSFRCWMSTSFWYKIYITFNINKKCTTSEHKSITSRVVYLHINKRIYAWIWFNECWFTCAVTLESCALDSSCSNVLFSKTLCARVNTGSPFFIMDILKNLKGIRTIHKESFFSKMDNKATHHLLNIYWYTETSQ